jgi:hypothetical protein
LLRWGGGELKQAKLSANELGQLKQMHLYIYQNQLENIAYFRDQKSIDYFPILQMIKK